MRDETTEAPAEADPSAMRGAERVELWPIDRLTPYAHNPRVHDAAQVAKIAASITEFGFTSPLLVDASGLVIAGHGRLEAAKLLGLAAVPVVVLGYLTDAQRRAYVIADNKLALDAAWDGQLLAAELERLSDESFGLEVVGFSDEELQEILEGTPPDPSDFDERPEGGYREQYGVVVLCADEAEQARVYEALQGEGYRCKVVAT